MLNVFQVDDNAIAWKMGPHSTHYRDLKGWDGSRAVPTAVNITSSEASNQNEFCYEAVLAREPNTNAVTAGLDNRCYKATFHSWKSGFRSSDGNTSAVNVNTTWIKSGKL